MIFRFPEEGCGKAYSHFWYLQAHLDTGRHEMVVEHETLYDKAGKLYASKPAIRGKCATSYFGK